MFKTWCLPKLYNLRVISKMPKIFIWPWQFCSKKVNKLRLHCLFSSDMDSGLLYILNWFVISQRLINTCIKSPQIFSSVAHGPTQSKSLPPVAAAVYLSCLQGPSSYFTCLICARTNISQRQLQLINDCFYLKVGNLITGHENIFF